MTAARVFFIEMMGVPGSFDASVYDHLDEREDEGLWFINRFGGFPGIRVDRRNVCVGEPLPDISELDAVVLAGSYNSVHDDTDWQWRVRDWLPGLRAARVPILGICGSHQLLAHMSGADVARLADGPFAGTLPVSLTAAAATHPLFAGIADRACFHYANGEHVTEVPAGATLLASSERVPVAALDYGDYCYSTQFHPEGTELTLGPIWQHKRPELMQRYFADDSGKRLVENFLQMVIELDQGRHRQPGRAGSAESATAGNCIEPRR